VNQSNIPAGRLISARVTSAPGGRHNGKQRDERGRMDPDAIDRVVRKYAGALGFERGYSAHSMRRHLSRRHSRTVPSSRMCRRQPGIATQDDKSSMIGAGTVLRKRRAFLRRTRDT
jgi:hypothetical protein